MTANYNASVQAIQVNLKVVIHATSDRVWKGLTEDDKSATVIHKGWRELIEEGQKKFIEQANACPPNVAPTVENPVGRINQGISKRESPGGCSGACVPLLDGDRATSFPVSLIRSSYWRHRLRISA